MFWWTVRSLRAVRHFDGVLYREEGNGSDVLTSKQARHTGNGSASEGAGPTDYQCVFASLSFFTVYGICISTTI